MRDDKLHKDDDIIIKQKKRVLIKNTKSFIKSLKDFFYEIIHIKEGTDIDGTIEGIKRDLVFKGHSIWILIASIFIACVGLNQNSTAVVIGAMLISPLMGPILGVGLAVGTYDWETLKKSLKFFAVAVFVSILTSYIYFLLTPLKDAQSELLSRTQPNLLDVFLGLFGGIAGIVAGSRREKSNVVPGVAIATALMPPLCTAGYGLATGQYSYFFGAFYLFFINSFFICLSTIVIVRYLKFPVMNYVKESRRNKIKIYMIIFIVIVILPGAKLSWEMIQKSRFNHRADNFIEKNFNDIKSDIMYKEITYTDTVSYINIYLAEKKFSNAKILDFIEDLNNHGLNGETSVGITVTDTTILNIHQGQSNADSLANKMNVMSVEIQKKLRVGILEDIYKKQEDIILSKNEKIEFLENKLIQIHEDSVPLTKLKSEMQIQYPKIQKFSYAKTLELNDSGYFDTIPTFLVQWKKYTYRSIIRKQSTILEKWLKVRLNLDTVRVIKY